MKKIIIVIVCFFILNGVALQAGEFNPLDVEFGTDLEQLILENADFFKETESKNNYVSAFGLSASGEGPYVRSLVLYEVDTENKIKALFIQINYYYDYDPDLPQRVFNRINEMNNNALIRPERYFRHIDTTTETIEWRHKDYSYGMIIYRKPIYGGTSMYAVELYKKPND